MKRKTITKFLLLIELVCLLALSGCWGARELNALSLVVGIGIDKKDANPEKIFMTAQIVRPEELKKSSSGEGNQGQEAKAYWNLESSGDTIFDAIREYTHETSNKLYDAHNEVIIFGKGAAQDGVQKYLDFFVRSQETRPTTEIVVSESTAAEVLDVQPELGKFPALNISKLIKAEEFTSQSEVVTMQDFVNYLLGKTTSAVAPIVSVTENGGEKILCAKGLAVFKQDKMIGELDGNETRGLMWVKGLVKSGVIDIPYLNGNASIEIKKAESNVKTEVKDGKVLIRIDIKEDGAMVAQTCIQNLETVQEMTILENLEQSIIQNEIQSTLNKARTFDADVFGFGEDVHQNHPKDWSQMESLWDSIFPTVQVDINVKCMIRSAGNITKPIEPE